MLDHSAPGVVIAGIRHSLAGLGTPEWAHVSGWAQLSGAPRTISCILICREAAPVLSALLPQLSDTLTEAGFPWEIICVDSASADATAQVLTSWCEIPGFLWLRLAQNYGNTAAARTGMRAARGDGIILIKATSDVDIESLPEMLDRWNQGHEIVMMRRGDGGIAELSSRVLNVRNGSARTPFDESGVTLENGFILIDRQVVDRLLA